MKIPLCGNIAAFPTISTFWYLTILPLLLIGNSLLAQDEPSVFLERDLLDVEDIIPVTSSNDMQVVAASRSSKNLTDLPFTVYVITREEILENHYTTLVDVLRSVPGMRVSPAGSADHGETFLMRGLFGNYFTKILVNNLPVQPSTLNGMPIGAQLPIRQAERIEIIYGPSSAVYGADAAAGVINIVTKVPEKPTFAQADVSFGQFGYSYLNFSAGGKAGKNKDIIHYNVYGSNTRRRDLNIKYENDLINPLNYLQQNGYTFEFSDRIKYQPKEINEALLERYHVPVDLFIRSVYPPYYKGTLTQPEIGEFPHESRLLGAQLLYRGFSISFDHMYRKDHSSLGRSPYLNTYYNPLNFIGETIQRATLSYEKSFDRFSTVTNLSYLQFRMDHNSSFGITYDINYDTKAIPNTGNAYRFAASDDILAEQLITFQLSKNIEIVAGGSFQHSTNLPVTNDLTVPFNFKDYHAFGSEKPSSHPYYGDFGYNLISFNNVAGFLQGSINFGKFSFITGIRGDQNSNYGGTLNPRLAVLYKLSKFTSIRASYGSAFRAPATSITYASLAIPQNDSIAYQIVPNPDLKPEYLKAYETGIRHEFTEKIFVDVAAYFNEIDNLIYSSIGSFDPANYPRAVRYAVSNTSPYFVRSNVNSTGAKAWLVGVQTSLNAKDIIPAIKLNASFNVSFAKGAEQLPENGKVFITNESPSFGGLIAGGGPHEVPASDRSIDNFRMMPRWMGQLSVDFAPIRNLYVRFDQVCTSSWIRRYVPDADSYHDPYYTIDGYFVMDALSSYRLNKNFQAFVKVKNVFNTTYAGIEPTGIDVDLPYNPQPGRNIQFGVSFKLE